MELHVVGARRYSFTDRETNRLVEGVNVYYLGEDNTDDVVGVIPAKVSLPYDSWEKIKTMTFPSICRPDLKQTLTAKGVKTNVVGLQFIKKVG